MADSADPGRSGLVGPDAVLAAELRELGRRLDVPTAPDLRAAVRARLAVAAGPARVRPSLALVSPLRPGPDWSRRATRAAAALIAFAVLAAGTLVASPRARAAVVEFFTFGAVRVHTGAPPVPSAPVATAPDGRFGGLLPGSRETTLAAARSTAVFPVAVPAALGAPDQVLVGTEAQPQFVALRYGPGPGRPPVSLSGVAVELDEFAGTPSPFLDKYLAGADATRVAVGGDRGVWIDGPHEVGYVDRSGQSRFEPARLAGRTLIWQHGDVTLRLEGEFSLEQAIAVALSVP